MSIRKTNYLTLFVSIAFICCSTCSASQDEAKSAEGWRSDVDFVVSRIEAIHPNPWYRISKDEFTALAEKLKSDIPSLSEDEIVVRLMQLVARLEDGHTYLSPSGAEGFACWFPIRVDKFAEGVFITAADKEHSAIVGARVVRVGSLSAEKAFELVGTAASADSPYSYPRVVPPLFSNAAVLKALGIIESKGTLQLEVVSTDGTSVEIAIPALSWKYSTAWARKGFAVPGDGECVSIFSGLEGNLPLHLKNLLTTDDPFWFELLPEHKTLYMQFNSVQDAKDETFKQFVERLWKFCDENEGMIEKFVLDLRYNAGGNGYLLLPFIHSFIKHERLSQRGRLYALVGAGSFSAATACLALLIEHTGVITVGQATSGPLNWCSDTVGQALPFSKLRMRISQYYWQGGYPTDDRGYYAPEFPVPLSAVDFFAGRDAALEAILDGKVRTLADVLRTEGAAAFEEEYRRLSAEFADIGWWFPYSQFDLRSLGYEMFMGGRFDEAAAAFKLNSAFHPQSWTAWDDLGDCYAEMGKIDSAIEYYGKALEIDPYNYYVEGKLKQLLEKKQIAGIRSPQVVARSKVVRDPLKWHGHSVAADRDRTPDPLIRW
jgi:tetratricopeptide (TPR) repeat protein